MLSIFESPYEILSLFFFLFFFSLSLYIISLFLWFFFPLALNRKFLLIIIFYFFIIALNRKCLLFIIFSFFIIFIFNYADILNCIGAYLIIITSLKYLKVSISYIIIFSNKADFFFLVFDLLYSFRSYPSFVFYNISYNMHWAFFLWFKCIYIFFIFQKNIKFNFILLHRFVIL